MNFNFKKAFISGVLSAGIILSSPLAVFASGKRSQEKKPFKETHEREALVRCEMINTGKTVESRQFKGFNFPGGKIILPKATCIKFGAFSECASLTKVYMPVVEEIGWFAFMSCPYLKEVIMPNVKEISCSAFFDCPSLEEIDLRKIEKISDSAFLGCRNLKKVVISDDVAVVAKDAFDSCSDELRIVYKGLPLSKEEFFKMFEGNTAPGMTIEEVKRLFL